MRVKRCKPRLPAQAAEDTAAVLLSEARKHYGTRLVCTPKGSGDDFATEWAYEHDEELHASPTRRTSAADAAREQARQEDNAARVGDLLREYEAEHVEEAQNNEQAQPLPLQPLHPRHPLHLCICS